MLKFSEEKVNVRKFLRQRPSIAVPLVLAFICCFRNLTCSQTETIHPFLSHHSSKTMAGGEGALKDSPVGAYSMICDNYGHSSRMTYRCTAWAESVMPPYKQSWNSQTNPCNQADPVLWLKGYVICFYFLGKGFLQVKFFWKKIYSCPKHCLLFYFSWSYVSSEKYWRDSGIA